jgi:hypothetical protein
MTLKSRLDRLTQRQPDRILILGGFLDPDLPTLPVMPRQPGETYSAWSARLHAEVARLYPHAPVVSYPHSYMEQSQ